jgi:Icc-related predicted phosphoesterase
MLRRTFGKRHKSHDTVGIKALSNEPGLKVFQLTLVFFTTDVHGSERCFMKFVNSAEFYKADVLILGGDVTGKMIIPLVEQADGCRTAEFAGQMTTVRTQGECDALVKTIRFSGYYPYLTTKDEMDDLNANPKKVDALFTKMMGETMERWMKIAEERLGPKGVKCFITPGNDDRFIIDEALSKSNYVQNPEGKVVWVDEDHEMISMGWSSPTPWNSPRETSEEDLEKKIEAMASQVKNMPFCIFNMHCPPKDTPLDPAPKIGKNLKAKTSGGASEMISAGSSAVRNTILKYQPLLGLHGHIHESKAATNLGRTLCLNPGSEYGEGVLRGALITLTKKGYKNYLFTQG